MSYQSKNYKPSTLLLQALNNHIVQINLDEVIDLILGLKIRTSISIQNELARRETLNIQWNLEDLKN